MACLRTGASLVLFSIVFLSRAQDDKERILESRHGGYFMTLDAYCSNYVQNSIKRFKPYAKDRWQCQDECDARPECTGFEMDCNIQCTLIGNCTTLVPSSCNTYVAVRNETEKFKQSVISIKRRALKEAVGGVGVVAAGVTALFCASWYCLSPAEAEQKERAVRRGVAVVKSGPRRLTTFLGQDHQQLSTLRVRIGCCLFLVITLLPLYTIYYFPADSNHGKRGICGLVHQDKTPFTLAQFLRIDHDRRLLIKGHLYTPPAMDAMPMNCSEIFVRDVVDPSTGTQCRQWCSSVTGDWFRPWCSMLMFEFGKVYKVCDKTLLWKWLSSIPMKMSFVVALAYGFLSLVVGYCRAQWECVDLRNSTANDRRPSDADSDAPQHAISKASAVSSLARTTSNVTVLAPCTPPADDTCKNNGPFVGGRHQFPLWPLPCRSDADGAAKQLNIAGACLILDPVGDMNGIVTLLLCGEGIYATILSCATFIPNLHDPIQSAGTAAFFISRKRGFPIKEFYRLQMREGRTEGVWSMMLCAFILMRNSAYRSLAGSGSQADMQVFLSVAYVIVSSLLFSIPHAARASYLLQDIHDINFDDYYNVARHRKEIGATQYLPGLDAFALSVAVGRGFSSSWLLLELWLIGAISGLLVSFSYAVLHGQCTWERTWKLACVFIFWPLSPTRLGAHRSTWLQLRWPQQSARQGGFSGLRSEEEDDERQLTPRSQTASTVAQSETSERPSSVDPPNDFACLHMLHLDTVWEFCSQGYASLPPHYYYCHRFFTLVAFWIFTFLRSDIEFYNVVFGNVKKAIVNNTLFDFNILLGDVVCSGLFIFGWLALLIEMITFLCYRDFLADMFDHQYLRPNDRLSPLPPIAEEEDDEQYE